MKRVVVLVAFLILLSGCSVKKVEEVTDSEKFSQEYNVSKNNPMVYVNYDKLMKLFEKARQDRIENLKKLKEKKPKKYKELINHLKDKKEKEEEEYLLSLPDIYSLKDGKILNHSNYFSKEEELSEEHLTKKIKEEIRKKYQEIITFKECIECD